MYISDLICFLVTYIYYNLYCLRFQFILFIHLYYGYILVYIFIYKLHCIILFSNLSLLNNSLLYNYSLILINNYTSQF